MRAWIIVLLTLVAVSLLVTGCRGPRVVVDPPGPGVVRVRAGPPPPPRLVVQPARPGPNYTWVQGHYVWENGDYRWVQGHWKVPPRRGAVWVPGHYNARRGEWVRGHWQ